MEILDGPFELASSSKTSGSVSPSSMVPLLYLIEVKVSKSWSEGRPEAEKGD
jgi:hypothetical protein